MRAAIWIASRWNGMDVVKRALAQALLMWGGLPAETVGSLAALLRDVLHTEGLAKSSEVGEVKQSVGELREAVEKDRVAADHRFAQQEERIQKQEGQIGTGVQPSACKWLKQRLSRFPPLLGCPDKANRSGQTGSVMLANCRAIGPVAAEPKSRRLAAKIYACSASDCCMI